MKSNQNIPDLGEERSDFLCGRMCRVWPGEALRKLI